MINTLTERELLVLKQIVRDYSENGQPIGSKRILADLPIKVSSATIRNDMAKLEDMGYIQKTHSSSGRVPSMQGYRYYVDNMITPAEVDSKDINKVQGLFTKQFQQLDDIVKTSADMLSELTHYTTVTLKPDQKNLTVQGFRVVPLGNMQIMLILVLSNGEITSQQFTIPKTIDHDELEKVVRIMNDRVKNQNIGSVFNIIHNDLPKVINKYLHSSVGMLDLFEDMVTRSTAEQYFVGGRLNLFDFSKTDDLKSVQNLLTFFTQSDQLNELLGPPNADMQIRIGTELSNQLLKDYSLITASYDVGSHGRGLVAVLGPTNMQYSKMVSLVDLFRGKLTQRLLQYYDNLDDS